MGWQVIPASLPLVDLYHFKIIISVEYNCNRQRSSRDEVAYFQNEEYPQSGEAPTMCLFNIPVVDDTICQIRYEFS